jgi:hypothetical protein
MYNTTGMSLNGIGAISTVGNMKDCKQSANDSFNSCMVSAGNNADARIACTNEYANALNSCKNAYGTRMVDAGATTGAQNFLNNQSLTVNAPRPLVSPARVNPTFSQIPAYSVSPVPASAYGDNATYGTYGNPIRLGNTEPAVDSTPDIFKKENLPKTIGITAGILVVGYFAYKEFGGKKSTRRRR